MTGKLIALLLVSPFVMVFLYAAWQEARRRRVDGHSNYGLVYDPETDTTHVSLLAEGESGYDPETDGAGSDDADPEHPQPEPRKDEDETK